MTSAIPPRPASGVHVEDVLCNAELERRPTRIVNMEEETQAMLALTRQIAAHPDSLLQRLAQAACDLIGAGSAGISMVETGGDGVRLFRWRATAGSYFPFAGNALPRDFSPCGVTLDRNAVQLMTKPERYYAYAAQLQPAVEEVLLAPFHRRGMPIGTIWVVSHGAGKRFDREDARLLVNLTGFASAAADMLSDL